VKLISYRIDTPFGPVTRIGAVDQETQYVDLQLGYQHFLQSRGVSQTAAHRIASAVLPGNMVDFIEGGDASRDAATRALSWAGDNPDEAADARIRLDPSQVKLLPPLPTAPLHRDFLAFEAHLKNVYPTLGREIPKEWYDMPVYYKGNPGSFGAHGDDVLIPYGLQELDYEFEIGMVIGKPGIDIRHEDALEHVFGFMIYNDFSQRQVQGHEMAVGLGPAKSKDFAGGHVFGPWLVTIDELPDVHALRMQSTINGTPQCDDSTASMHWTFEDLIVHASKGEPVAAGEIFGSGTVGLGSGAEVGKFLQSGDTVELTVEGLGTLRNRVVSQEA